MKLRTELVVVPWKAWKKKGHMSNQPHPAGDKLQSGSLRHHILPFCPYPLFHSYIPIISSFPHTPQINQPTKLKMAASALTTSFLGTRLPGPKTPGPGKFRAFFNFGTKKASPPPKKSPPPRPTSDDRPVWFPGAEAPEWLDGSMVGDRGFDPFGLGKPAEYLQFDYDGLDQNLAKNVPGDVIGVRFDDGQVNPTPLQPYNEVFGIQRFRECEVIHGRWAMLATLGALAVEGLTGVAWQDAGKVELIEGSSYLGLKLPFSLTALIWIEVLLVGYIEFQRNAELDPEKRLYPGGKFFDPLGLAEDPDKKLTLQLAEIKHSRLAMVAFLGFAIQAATTGQGPLSNAAAFLSDPSNNIFKTLTS